MFEIELQPALTQIERELRDVLETKAERSLRQLTRLAPAEMKDLMNQSAPSGRRYARARGTGFTRAHIASAKGQPPAKDTFELYNSIRGKMTGKLSAEIEFAEHAKWLDPVFGGYLNRPFIEKGLESAVKKLESF